MKANQTKTVRFKVVVDKAGEPEAVNLWTDPKKDKHFNRALKENRVMTLKQETVGSKKDFGQVGFYPEKNVAYLVFPKALTNFKQHRVVGIKYDLIRSPGPLGPVVKPAEPHRYRWQPRGVPSEPRSKAQARADEKPAKRFRVSVEFVSRVELAQDVEADSKSDAREKAEAAATMPDFTQGTVTRKVRRITQLR